MVNAWMELVKKTSAENKGKSLGEILQLSRNQFKNVNNKVSKKTRNRKPPNFRKSRAKR